MTPEALQAFFSLAIGFAVAGFLTTGYQLVAESPLTCRLMTSRARLAALGSVPLLIFAAPFLIMRGLLSTPSGEPRGASFAAMVTITAGFWSLMCGTVVAEGWSTLILMLQ